VQNAVVRADSIVGIPWGSTPAGSRVAVARAQVDRIDVGETDRDKTGALIFGIVVVTLGGAYLILYEAFHHLNT